MANKTLTISWKPGGVATDFDSTPVLKDSGNTFGIKETISGTVVVAAGTAFTHTGTGSYSYTATGLTAGLGYTFAVAYVANGATTYVQDTFTAGSDSAVGYYTNQTLIQQRGGKANTDGEANLDGTGISIVSVYQNVIDRNDEWADRELRAANYVAPLPTTSVDFDTVRDILTDRARAVLYFVRGQFDEKPDMPSGQFAVLKMEAEQRFRAMLSPLNVPLDCPTTQTRQTGPDAVATQRRGVFGGGCYPAQWPWCE